MRRWNARTKLLLAIVFSVLGTVSFFRGPLFFPKLCHIPYDLVDFHQPLFELISSSLRNTGQLPWWNPYSYMGEPFYANVQAAMFYPPTLLTVLLGWQLATYRRWALLGGHRVYPLLLAVATYDLIAVMVLSYLVGGPPLVSRAWLLGSWMATIVLLAASRLVWRRLALRWQPLSRPLLQPSAWRE
jgi:hypothetical protein